MKIGDGAQQPENPATQNWNPWASTTTSDNHSDPRASTTSNRFGDDAWASVAAVRRLMNRWKFVDEDDGNRWEFVTRMMAIGRKKRNRKGIK